MPECTFISKPRPSALLLFLLLAALATAGAGIRAFAADEQQGAAAPTPRTQIPEEEDFKDTPYTGYGEFNEQEEEDDSARFFQFGRFFGVSIGGGVNGVTGNRGALYQGGVPAVEFKLLYWFDFNFALEMGITSTKHFYDSSNPARGHADISLTRLGLDLRYSLPIQDLSAPITFANPYLVLGGGSFSKTESFRDQGVVDSDTGVGLSVGAGLEFTLWPRKAYAGLSARYHMVTFKDTYTTDFTTDSLQDLTGGFYTLTGSVLFTW